MCLLLADKGELAVEIKHGESAAYYQCLLDGIEYKKVPRQTKTDFAIASAEFAEAAQAQEAAPPKKTRAKRVARAPKRVVVDDYVDSDLASNASGSSDSVSHSSDEGANSDGSTPLRSFLFRKGSG